jgi:hypothetical protein
MARRRASAASNHKAPVPTSRATSFETLAMQAPQDEGISRLLRSRNSCFYTDPRLQASRFAGAFQNGDHSDRADVRFARPNIQIYDAHVVDLHQWVCARYLVGVEGAETKAQLSSALERISERITLASKPCPAQTQSASQTSKKDLPYISI